MRNGRWVTTSKDIPGAHQVDGRALGIYQRGGKDAQGNESPEHVAIVRPNGENLMQPSADGNAMVPVTFRPGELPDLQELQDLSHVPRVGAHRATA